MIFAIATTEASPLAMEQDSTTTQVCEVLYENSISRPARLRAFTITNASAETRSYLGA